MSRFESVYYIRHCYNNFLKSVSNVRLPIKLEILELKLCPKSIKRLSSDVS